MTRKIFLTGLTVISMVGLAWADDAAAPKTLTLGVRRT